MPKLRGVLCPTATPWDHAGELYPAKVRHHIEKLNRTGLSGYWVASHAGEGALLAPEETRRLYDLVREAAADGKTLAADVSAESVKTSVALGNAAVELGYGPAVAAPPRTEWAGDLAARARLYFVALADRSPSPLYLDLTAAGTLDADAVLGLARHPRIVGVFAPADPSFTERLISDAPDDFDVVAGDIDQFVQMWDQGVRAAAAPLANAIPFHCLSIEEALRTREPDAAAKLLDRAAEALRAIYPALGPAGLKHAMDLRGAFGGAPRLPGAPLSPDERARVEQALDGLLS